ncbi:MAG TPA: peptidase C15 [Microvirga sp.]|jgi:pyroglutamyl-peptidase|nr:peptidase C15 [Microvirga sp.]
MTKNRPPRLLVTGFGPFPGIPKNPSEVAARRIARDPRWRRLGIEVEALALSTTYDAVERELRPALARSRPDALLMIGVAGRSREVRVETRGLNRASILLPDAAKVRPVRLQLERAPLARVTRARPLRQVVTLRRHGFRARASINAGHYLCNASYFAALPQSHPVLFVHIPKPGRAVRKSPGARRGRSWHERLAAALGEVGLDLLRQARQA